MEINVFNEFFEKVCLNEKKELTQVGQFIVVIMGISLLRTLITPRKEKNDENESYR